MDTCNVGATRRAHPQNDPVITTDWALAPALTARPALPEKTRVRSL